MKEALKKFGELIYDLRNSLNLEESLAAIYEEILRLDRDNFRKHNKDSFNGFYRRNALFLGKVIKIKVPRTREGKFRSSVAPPKWDRKEDLGERLLDALLSSMEYEEVEDGRKRRMMEYLEELNGYPIKDDVAILVLTNHPVKFKRDGRKVSLLLYVVIGFTPTGDRRALHVSLSGGGVSVKRWKDILRSLIERGLKGKPIIITNVKKLNRYLGDFFGK